MPSISHGGHPLFINRNHPKYADLLIAKKLASVYSRVFL